MIGYSYTLQKKNKIRAYLFLISFYPRLQITTAFCKKKMFKCSSTLIGLESPALTRLNRGLGSPLGNFSYNLWYKYQWIIVFKPIFF